MRSALFWLTDVGCTEVRFREGRVRDEDCEFLVEPIAGGEPEWVSGKILYFAEQLPTKHEVALAAAVNAATH